MQRFLNRLQDEGCGEDYADDEVSIQTSILCCTIVFNSTVIIGCRVFKSTKTELFDPVYLEVEKVIAIRKVRTMCGEVFSENWSTNHIASSLGISPCNNP